VNNKKIRFDGWALDLDSGDLERGGSRSRLQEQPLQVLRELVAQAGSVVTREQLISILWPKGVVDFDTGLNTAVRKLRSSLGDTAETPRYIETLPGAGIDLSPNWTLTRQSRRRMLTPTFAKARSPRRRLSACCDAANGLRWPS
jgi:DNA-binding winged helix-turn-helix (wHTH) protein